METPKQRPKVSIFIPVYNGECFIATTLDSVLKQSYRNWEVLCVDDSSTDGSFAILRQYAEKDGRIKVYRKENGGDVPHSWQFITPHITGDYTLYMSQDDLLDADTLEKLVCRQEETGADAVIPTVIWYQKGASLDNANNLVGVGGDTKVVLSGKEAFELMMDYSIAGNAIWKTQIVKDFPVGIISYNSDEYSQRDWASRCAKVAFSDARFYYSQNNPNAITKQRFSEMYLYNSLADSMMIVRAHEIGASPQRISELANDIFLTLESYVNWLHENRNSIQTSKIIGLKRMLKAAYNNIRADVTLEGWKNRLGRVCFGCFEAVVVYKRFAKQMKS